MTDTSDARGRGETATDVKLDPNDPDYVRDPYPTYSELREKCPVAHSDEFGGFWMLSRYHDIREASRDTELFSSAQGVTLPPVGNPMPFLPIELDPPEHAKYRKTMQTWFSVRAIEKLEPTVRDIVSGLIDDIEAQGHADFTEALAGPLPPIVIALLLGLPREDWPRFRELAETMVNAAEEQDQERGAVSGMELMGYLYNQIEARRTAPADDMLTRMIAIEIDGEPIAPDAVLGLALFLLMAGHETSVGGISMMLLHIARNQEVQQRLIADPSLVPKAVEEALRLEPPIQTIARTVSRDVCLHGVDLAEGEKIVLAWGSANRDTAIFPDRPDEFVVDRERNPHIAFGDGIHRCLGAALARLEMRIVLEEVLRRLPGYRISDESQIEVGGFLARHVRRLPVEW
jgi:cytochrome P450